MAAIPHSRADSQPALSRRWVGVGPVVDRPRTLVGVRVRFRLLAAAVAVTAAGVGVGIYLEHPDSASTPSEAARPSQRPTTLADVDTTTMVVQRRAFCDRVPSHDVEQALGGPATGSSSYDDGDTAHLGSVTDVAQEYGCAWTGPKGTKAHAWVFAPPVTKAWAHQLADSVPAGCRRQPQPDYGKPTLAYTCTDHRRTTVSLHGLFGDAWLSCDLTGARREPAAAVAERAERWCLATAVAAG